MFNCRGKIFALSFLILLSYPLTGIAEQHNQQTPASQQRFDDINYWVKAFENPERDKWQKPDEVVKALNLRPGDVIADLGAGTGYFTRRLAVAVGPEGKARGLDVEPAMVKYMEEDAKKLNLKNYIAGLVKPDDAGREPNSVDVVLIVDTYHHIENRVDYLKRLSKSLKANGRVVVIDFHKKPLPVGPQDLEHKLAEETVNKEFHDAGYHVIRSQCIVPYQYFIEFGL